MKKAIFMLLVAFLVIFSSCQKDPEITIYQEVDVTVQQFDPTQFQEILDRLDEMEANQQTQFNILLGMLEDLQNDVNQGNAANADLLNAIEDLATAVAGNTNLLNQLLTQMGDLADDQDLVISILNSLVTQLADLQDQVDDIDSQISTLLTNVLTLVSDVDDLQSMLNNMSNQLDDVEDAMIALSSDFNQLEYVVQQNHNALVALSNQVLTALAAQQNQLDDFEQVQQQILSNLLSLANEIEDLQDAIANLNFEDWDQDYWQGIFGGIWGNYFNCNNGTNNPSWCNWNNYVNNIIDIVNAYNVPVEGLNSNQIGEKVAYLVLMSCPSSDGLQWFNQQLVYLNDWGYPINWYQAMLAVLNNSATQNNTIAPTVVGQILTANLFNLSAGQEACLLCHLHSDFPSLGYGSNSDCVLAGGSGCN